MLALRNPMQEVRVADIQSILGHFLFLIGLNAQETEGFPHALPRYGGAGFIGSNTVDELVRRGHSVVVLDDLSSGKEDNLAEIRSKIRFIKGSITDIEVVRNAMYEVEYVLHLAARTSVPRSVKDPIETNKINIDGTLNVLVAAKELKVKRLVFAASSSAYGETPTLPKIETMPPQPISPYGVTKYVGEL